MMTLALCLILLTSTLSMLRKAKLSDKNLSFPQSQCQTSSGEQGDVDDDGWMRCLHSNVGTTINFHLRVHVHFALPSVLSALSVFLVLCMAAIKVNMYITHILITMLRKVKKSAIAAILLLLFPSQLLRVGSSHRQIYCAECLGGGHETLTL